MRLARRLRTTSPSLTPETRRATISQARSHSVRPRLAATARRGQKGKQALFTDFSSYIIGRVQNCPIISHFNLKDTAKRLGMNFKAGRRHLPSTASMKAVFVFPPGKKADVSPLSQQIVRPAKSLVVAGLATAQQTKLRESARAKPSVDVLFRIFASVVGNLTAWPQEGGSVGCRLVPSDDAFPRALVALRHARLLCVAVLFVIFEMLSIFIRL